MTPNEQKLIDYYRKHNPDNAQVSKVRNLLLKYKGNIAKVSPHIIRERHVVLSSRCFTKYVTLFEIVSVMSYRWMVHANKVFAASVYRIA